MGRLECVQINKFTVGQHSEPLRTHHNKAAGNNLITLRQHARQRLRRQTEPAQLGIVQRDGDLLLGIAIQFNPRQPRQIHQLALQALGLITQAHHRCIATHCQHHRRNIQQPVIQLDAAHPGGKRQLRARHCLTYTIPGRIGVVDIVIQHDGYQRDAGASGSLDEIDFRYLRQLIGQRLQHQTLDRLGHRAGVNHRDQTRPIRKAGVFLSRHGQVGRNTQQRQHHHHHTQQTRTQHAAQVHGSNSTLSPSANRLRPA